MRVSEFWTYIDTAKYAMEFNVGYGSYSNGLPHELIAYFNSTVYCNNFNASVSFAPTSTDGFDLLLSSFAIGYRLEFIKWLTLNPRLGMSSWSVGKSSANDFDRNNTGLLIGLTASKALFRNRKHKLTVGLAFDYYRFEFNNHPVFNTNNHYLPSALVGYKFYFGKQD